MKNNINVAKNKKKVLLIGANGFLGLNLIQSYTENEQYKKEFYFHLSDIKSSNIPKNLPFTILDITNKEDVRRKIIKIHPDIILLTAAMTDVDQNEINKDLAEKINKMGPINVMEACKKTGSKLIFLSTDFVFDGKKPIGESYDEKDTPNPISYYGKTKFEAEKAIIESDISFLLCRTAVLYGWNPEKPNYITWVLNKLKQGNSISIVTNQINNATHVKNLADILIKLMQKDVNGIYHTAGIQALNRYEMALKCAEIFNYDRDLITPIDSIIQKAPRPENAALNVSKLKELIGSELEIFSLEMGLNYMKATQSN